MKNKVPEPCHLSIAKFCFKKGVLKCWVLTRKLLSYMIQNGLSGKKKNMTRLLLVACGTDKDNPVPKNRTPGVPNKTHFDEKEKNPNLFQANGGADAHLIVQLRYRLYRGLGTKAGRVTADKEDDLDREGMER